MKPSAIVKRESETSHFPVPRTEHPTYASYSLQRSPIVISIRKLIFGPPCVVGSEIQR
jgi:hypothetical protein